MFSQPAKSEGEITASDEGLRVSDQVHGAQNEALIFHRTGANNDEGVYFGARYQ